MSQAIPSPANCCDPCESPLVVNIPGPQGESGDPGTDGVDGINAFSFVTANFTQPAVNANVVVSVDETQWVSVGQDLFVETGGYYLVIAKGGSSLTLKNLGYTANAAPAATILAGTTVGPAGEKGETGATGSSGTTALTTKGDLLTHDGATTDRLAVGTDGKVLAADSAQALGVVWNTVQPNTATDNAAARYDGTAGKPVPLQDSKLVITDDGAVQASGSGGNARGARAVDLQVIRSLATQVASGIESVVAGGNSNLASGTDAAIGGGFTNIASGEQSTVAGGVSNQATDDFATVGGGDGNIATALSAVVAGGHSNNASGIYSAISGGNDNMASGRNSTIPGGDDGFTDLHGQLGHSSGAFANPGDAQASELIWRNVTTNATPTELFLDGAGERAVIRNGFSWAFLITVIARQDNGDSAAWYITGGIENVGGVPALIAAINATLIGADAGSIATGWGILASVAVTADTVNDSLKIAVTGTAAAIIRWVAHARLVEVFNAP